ncbi:MAG: hypothetical protein NTZ20_03255, partial [Candidatus Levybacteria bacterium]|nr:hypothetical protein [Candidatus Levybacteria bacterium]
LGTAPVASFSGQTSFATMVVGNDGFGDIFTASKSGLTKFTILNSGNVGIGTTVASRTLSINGETEANAFYDISNNSYFLDPAAVGTSLRIAGSASFNGDLTLGGGTGKLDVGTVDPPYTINGEKYATFIPAMTGIKEETTGKARTSEYVSGLGYKYTIDFTKVEKGSDLWLFSKATDMGKNIGKIIPLMSATDNTKIWYNIDESNYSLTLYSAKPTTIAYRLTAPRFDADIIDITKSSSPGFILNDGKELHAMTKSGNFTDEELLNINNLQIIKYESRYDLRTKSGEIIHEVASYSEIVVANLRAGLINAREIIAKSITTGQLTVSKEIISPIAEIDRIHTNLISPLSSDNIVVDGKLVIANKENVSDNEIILEVQGNASISGVLRAGKIIADEIIGLDAKIATLAGKNITNITNIYSNASTSATIDSQNDSSSGDNIAKINTEDLLIDVPIFSGLQNINPSILANDIVTDFIDTASLSGQLAKITNFQSMFGRFDQIMVTGPASFNDISIVGQLSIGGNMIFADNSLNVLGADLELQSLKQGGISIAGKMIYIDANGNINSKGNATFAKEVNIGGTLSTNTISPNKDSDLVINLPEVSKTNQDFSKKGSNFIVNNASQSAVFALDQEGNMQASGSADFKNILANALKIVRNAQADTSFTETVATSSAGTATIITGETERTIITPYSTKDALIYLTSASDMDGLSPYVARQTIADESLGIKASFTIQISQRLNKDVKINWIIIN